MTRHVGRSAIARIVLLTASAVVCWAQSTPQFTVSLNPVTIPGLPSLQSSAWAQSGGKWLLVGGRTNGLHLFVQSSNQGATPPANAFPTASANTNVWVIDPVNQKVYSESLQSTGLSPTIVAQLSGNNAQHAQNGDTLYIIGGYGSDGSGNMITFPYLTAIQVSEAINAIINQQPLAPYIQQTNTFVDCPLAGANAFTSCQGAQQPCKPGPTYQQCIQQQQNSCLLQQHQATTQCASQVQSGSVSGLPTDTGYYARVTGGGMLQAGNYYYLVMGQDFEGLYSTAQGDYGKWPVNQVYTERIAAFWFTPPPYLSAAVLQVWQQDPNDSTTPYHRRDLNVVPELTASGDQNIGVYGGVFVPGQDVAYRNPILIENPSDLTKVSRTAQTYQQMMSQYECAQLSMADQAGGNMIHVFFGGISLYYLDSKTMKLRMDEGLPFIANLSTVVHNSSGVWSEFVSTEPLPGLMGADAMFIPNPSAAAAANGVVLLNQLQGKTLVGWIFGGILAQLPEAGSSKTPATQASNALYEVWVTPGTPPANYWMPAVAPVATAAAPPPKPKP